MRSDFRGRYLRFCVAFVSDFPCISCNRCVFRNNNIKKLSIAHAWRSERSLSHYLRRLHERCTTFARPKSWCHRLAKTAWSPKTLHLLYRYFSDWDISVYIWQDGKTFFNCKWRDCWKGHAIYRSFVCQALLGLRVICLLLFLAHRPLHSKSLSRIAPVAKNGGLGRGKTAFPSCNAMHDFPRDGHRAGLHNILLSKLYSWGGIGRDTEALTCGGRNCHWRWFQSCWLASSQCVILVGGCLGILTGIMMLDWRWQGSCFHTPSLHHRDFLRIPLAGLREVTSICINSRGMPADKYTYGETGSLPKKPYAAQLGLHQMFSVTWQTRKSHVYPNGCHCAMTVEWRLKHYSWIIGD